MPDPHELEGKFAATPADLARILELDRIGDFHLTEQTERTQTDLYYDTATLALRARSCSLRLREIGDTLKATFKGPRQSVVSAENESHLIKRVEIEVAVTPALTDDAPFVDRTDLEPVLRARELIGNGVALEPLARLVTRRRMRQYERADGQSVELSLDDVAARDLRNERDTHIVELELELIEGSEETLVTAAESLRRAVPGLRPSSKSKLERTLTSA